MIIETTRLILKPIDKISFKNIIYQLNDIDLKIPLPKNPTNYHIEKFLKFNEKIKSFNSFGYFSITLKKNFHTIGLVSIIPRYLNDNLINELGYLVSQKYANKGFASEVVLNTLNFVFTKTNISKIYCLMDKNNTISKHILKNKLKFDFIDVILDANTFKDLYTIDKYKFTNTIKPLLKAVNNL